MTQAPTVIPQFTQAEWTEALLADFPIPWTSQAARMPGGVLYGMMGACAANLFIINQFLVYGFDACRLPTAFGFELELYADDFYGPGNFPRKTAESDASYRTRIQAGLFIPYTTRGAFIQAITALTGIAPRLVSPWIAGQTAAYDWMSYWDIDAPEYPALYGQSDLNYQGFVIAELPPPTGQEQATAIWGYDAGAAYDIYTGTFWDLTAQNFITQEDLDNLILRIKAFGITIWRKYLNAGSLPFPIAQSVQVASNQVAFPINIAPFNGPYIVIPSCNWNTTLYVTNLTATGFTINSTSPSPSGATLNYVILPVTLPGVGFVGLSAGQLTATIPAPEAPAISSNRAIFGTSYNTNVAITSITPTEVNISLSSPASNGDILYYYFTPPTQSAVQMLVGEPVTAFVSIPLLPACCPFIVPSWNSACAITAASNGIGVSFSSVPPPGASIGWGYFPLAGG